MSMNTILHCIVTVSCVFPLFIAIENLIAAFSQIVGLSTVSSSPYARLKTKYSYNTAGQYTS